VTQQDGCKNAREKPGDPAGCGEAIALPAQR
jgi:hypothetical protein